MIETLNLINGICFDKINLLTDYYYKQFGERQLLEISEIGYTM
jgi:hypothetical protein